MKRRLLAPEDLELWRKVTDQTTRLDLGHKVRHDADIPKPTPPTIRKAKSVILGKPQGKQRIPGHSLIPSLPDQLRAAPVQMDQKAFGKLKRGKLKPEGRIDLHGMTLEHAHPALNRFILSAHANGKRLVLVITGKGKRRDEGGPIPVRDGILRHQVPQWLAMPPLNHAILQVTQAHVSHGGGGAYYVYLRRHR